jgi:hypothetical protein
VDVNARAAGIEPLDSLGTRTPATFTALAPEPGGPTVRQIELSRNPRRRARRSSIRPTRTMITPSLSNCYMKQASLR